MARASKACSHHDCPHLQPCPRHPAVAWQGSRRREKTALSGWEQQRRARMVLVKHGGICHWCEDGGADQVDHVQPLSEGGADDETNLRPIHAVPCHQEKSSREAQRARNPH